MADDDPVVFAKISINSADLPTFTGGRDIMEQLEGRTRKKRLIDDVINAPEQFVSFFGKIFPEVQKENNVGLNKSEDMNIWRSGKNEINIEEDLYPPLRDNKDNIKWDVYVGGPAALFAAVLQARSEKPGHLLYAHDGVRGVSNWKGSASTYITRDSLPLYYYSCYSAPRVIYSTLTDAVHRRVSYSSYLNKIETDPYWSNLRVSFSSLLSDPGLVWMALRNQIKGFLDVGLYLPGTAILPPHKTTAHTSIPHVLLTPKILRELKLDYPVLVGNSERSMMLSASLGKIKKKPMFINSDRRIDKIVGTANVNKTVSPEEVSARGYDPNFVLRGEVRHQDGTISMAADVKFEEDILKHGGTVQSNLKLVKILVIPSGYQDCEVSRVVWEDTKTGEQTTTNINTLYISLGPSMEKLMVMNGKNSWLGNLFPQKNLIETIMHAASSSMVVLVKIDRTLVPDDKLIKFRDIMGYSNKVYYRLGEREVDVDGRPFQFFAMQFVGGGRFPSQHVHSEAALNALKATISPILCLNSEGVEFEVVSVRSCARGVTAENFLRLCAPAANMTMIYGLGGTGMATMVPNALLLNALMRQRQQLAAGDITEKQFKRNLQKSKFDEIPNWTASNPFEGNYFQFFDIKTHKTVAQNLFAKNKKISSSRIGFPVQRLLKLMRIFK